MNPKMEKGHCFSCGSDAINFKDRELEGESIGYNFECRKCLKKGIEWYDLVYCNTIMEE